MPEGQSLLILPRVTLETSKAELYEFWRIACLGITGAMNTPASAAYEVLLGLPGYLLIESEAHAGMHRLICNE
jgi:hypothetical protein